jgi:hypothetical protein
MPFHRFGGGVATNPSRRGRSIDPVLDRLGEVTGPSLSIVGPIVTCAEHDFDHFRVPDGM